MTATVSPNNALSFSAFQGQDEFSGAGARHVLDGDRRQEMERRGAYYHCKQHDRKFWDFDGHPINPRVVQPLISAGTEQAFWIPLKFRRPSTPIRLGKVIVDSFTNLVFGENRFPTITVEGDELTEDWVQTISRIGRLPLKMIQARSYGGSSGTVGMSWCFHRGKPRFEVHRAEDLFVHRWADRLDLIPEWVSEVTLRPKTKWNGKGYDKVWYWCRRDWTPDGDYVFEEIIFDKTREPEWKVDWEKSTEHGDGVCHFEWIQNLPTDEVDGLPDYDGLYDNFDHVDLLMSIITRGAVANLDPTLVLKVDSDLVNRFGVKKGSDNSLSVGESGDAAYLELEGRSIESGLNLVKEHRRNILEAAQCIVPDPHEVAAQGVSSVAIKAMFAPMTAKADVIREQYGASMERMLKNMEDCARRMTSVPVNVVEQVSEEVVDEHGNVATVTTDVETPVLFEIDLPPKIVTVPLTDPLTGEPSGEEKKVRVPRVLGEGGEIQLTWPPYFIPTPQDQSQIVTALSLAAGGKQVLSVETSVETCARAFGKDPNEEWKRVREEGQRQQQQEAAMADAAAIGGQVSDPNELPPGAEEKKDEEPPPKELPDPVPPKPMRDPDAHVPVDLNLTGK